MLRLVLDTNVVLDLLHFRDVSVEPILQALRSGRAECFTQEACLGELASVLAYPQFKLDEGQASRILDEYAVLARHCDDTPDNPLAPLPQCRDPDDQKFLALAQRARADMLVTKDKALLALARKAHRLAGVRILTPSQAAACLDGRAGQGR
jgi:putative PIN family toxin of toxin-antitoxin system